MGHKRRKKPQPLDPLGVGELTEPEVREILADSKENVRAMAEQIKPVFQPTAERLLLN